jgi:hypothetical protein
MTIFYCFGIKTPSQPGRTGLRIYEEVHVLLRGDEQCFEQTAQKRETFYVEICTLRYIEAEQSHRARTHLAGNTLRLHYKAQPFNAV